MNIILINTDTWRQDYFGCYGNNWIHTENIDRFAKHATVFDRAYVGSFPTTCVRFDLFTGRYVYAYPEWNDKLHLNEVVLPAVLSGNGYTTMFIVDNPHMLRSGNHMERGFRGFWWVRGQEFDPLMTAPPAEQDRGREQYYHIQHLRNRRMWHYEEHWPVARTMLSAERWLELNYNQHEKFFLHIETFDPHEPWDPPAWYTQMYDPDWSDGDIFHPSYGMDLGDKGTHDASQLTGRQLQRLKALYAGNVTLCDRWIGRLLQKIEDLGLLENTMIIITSDHGTQLGEHGYIHKRGYGGIDPMYEETARIPFIVRLPNAMNKPGRSDAFVQQADIMPTVLEFGGVEIPECVQGKSFLPVLQGKKKEIRDFVVSCGSLLKPPQRITVTTKEWSYIPVNSDRKTDDLDRPVTHELYHLPSDPGQTQNLYHEKRDVAKDLQDKLLTHLESLGPGKKLLKEHRDINSFFLKYATGENFES